jgi:hypothetical protein
MVVLRFPSLSAADSRSLRFKGYALVKKNVQRSTTVHFRRSLGGVRCELMQRLSMFLHGSMGSYLRDALHEGNANVVAYLPATRA